VLSRALDPFFTTRDVGKGTGLGLPMVLGIVQGHQGYLTIDSAPGQGTCAGLYLPRLTSPARPGESRPSFAAGEILEPETIPGRNILVVDDEEAVLDVVRRFLEIAGHRATCASSSKQALELFGSSHFDLVILDLMMPGDDGLSTLHCLRQQQPTLPVLLCTGVIDGHPSAEHLRAEASGLIHKPFRMNELWYAVEQALEQRPSE
jgi:CheY-like chemotaxis protein